jgi:hypothetical protein
VKIGSHRLESDVPDLNPTIGIQEKNISGADMIGGVGGGGGGEGEDDWKSVLNLD